ncbi:hypothetical protein [Leptospira montravelensis]|nr:hypothetical protein [Leptospira montravelensis]
MLQNSSIKVSRKFITILLCLAVIISCRSSADLDHYYPGINQNSFYITNYRIPDFYNKHKIIINDNIIHLGPGIIFPVEVKGGYLNQKEIIENFYRTSICESILNSDPNNVYTFEYNFENPAEENRLLYAFSILSIYLIPNTKSVTYTLTTKFSINNVAKKVYTNTKIVRFFDWLPLAPYALFVEPYKEKESYLFYLLMKETNLKIEKEFFR